MNTTKIIALSISLIVLLGTFVLFNSKSAKGILDRDKLQIALEEISNSDTAVTYLDTEDPQDARLVLYRLFQIDKERSFAIAKDLWDENNLFNQLKFKETYRDPIARLKIAQILWAQTSDEEYALYIKSQSKSNDWMILSCVAEALADIDDMESVSILGNIAMYADNLLVARVAVTSLRQLSSYGKTAVYATKEIERLSDRIKQINAGVIRIQSKGTGDVAKPLTPNQEEFETEVHKYYKVNDYKGAVTFLLPYAREGNPKAQHLLGETYLALTPPDYDNGVFWINEAISQDYTDAKYSLANLYLGGKGVEKNVQKAVELLREAEREGDKEAAELLATARKNGWWGL